MRQVVFLHLEVLNWAGSQKSELAAAVPWGVASPCSAFLFLTRAVVGL